MSDRLLTDAERDRFALWLEQDAESTRQLIVQAENISMPPSLIQQLKLEAAASAIVARKLRQTEGVSR